MHSRQTLAVVSSLALLLQCLTPGLVLAAGQSTEEPETPREEVAAADSPTEGDEDRPPQAIFETAVDVKVVNVNVYVRDKKGNPITGLTKDDFEIFENKQPMPITNFYEVRQGERTDVKPKKKKEERGVPVRSHPGLDPLAYQVPEDRQLHLVIYVDHFNIRPFSRNKVFRYVRQFLRENLERGDKVMLVSYNRSLKVERPFTSDPQLISNALYSLEKHTGGRVQYDSEARDLLRTIDDARDPYQMEGRIRLFSENVFNDMQFTLDALKDFTMSLAGIPGRKAILYVSEGLPMRAGEEFYYAADDKLRSAGSDGNFAGYQSNLLESLQYDTSRRFRDITNHANANDVTFYTIDAAGLRTNSMTSAENAGYNTNFSSTYESVKTANLQEPLHYMADRTGGQSIVNTNNFLNGLERVATDFDHYYSLGYSPGHAGSGKPYNIEVKVNRKGVKVRHKEGYRDKSVEDEMAERTSASLRYGYENNELGIRLERGEEIRREDGTYVVRLEVKLPLGGLTLIPTADDTYQARIRLWLQAADEKGLSDVQLKQVPIEIKTEDPERMRKGYFTYELPLMMRGGDQRIAIGVRDDLAARTSFVSRVLSVGS